MDLKFIDDLNRKLEAIHNPHFNKVFNSISQIAAIKEAVVLNPAFTEAINHAKLSNIAILNPAFTESAKWTKISEDIMKSRSLYDIPIINQGLIDAMQNSIDTVRNLPPQLTSFQQYVDVMKPLSYIWQYQKDYSVLLNGTQVVSFGYDWAQVLQQGSEDSEEVKEEIIVGKTDKIRNVIHRIYQDNSQLLTVDPRDFEKMIAELMKYQGYEVELTKQTRDGGYDIIALKTLDGFPLKFLVECKRNTVDPVGVAVVRGFCDVLTNTEKVNKGIIVTTSYFSSEAEQRRLQNPYLLDFRDREDVLKWVSDYTLFKI